LGVDAESASHSTALVNASVEQEIRKVGRELHEYLLELVSEPSFRLGGAKWLAAGILQQLRSDAHQCRESGDQCRVQHREALDQLKRALAPQRKSTRQPHSFDDYGRQCFDHAVEQAVLKSTGSLISIVIEALLESERTLQLWATEWTARLQADFTRPDRSSAGSSLPESFPLPQVKQAIGSQIRDLVERVETHLHHGFLHAAGGLRKILSQSPQSQSSLSSQLLAACNAVVAAAERELRLDALAESAGMSSSDIANWLATQVTATRPSWTRGPGELRLMMSHGDDASMRKMIDSFADASALKPTLVTQPQGEFVVCQELQNVPFAQLVYSLLSERSEALEFIDRLHTRSDIHWTHVNEQFQTC
jgi:hypothetical protein